MEEGKTVERRKGEAWKRIFFQSQSNQTRSGGPISLQRFCEKRNQFQVICDGVFRRGCCSAVLLYTGWPEIANFIHHGRNQEVKYNRKLEPDTWTWARPDWTKCPKSQSPLSPPWSHSQNPPQTSGIGLGPLFLFSSVETVNLVPDKRNFRQDAAFLPPSGNDAVHGVVHESEDREWLGNLKWVQVYFFFKMNKYISTVYNCDSYPHQTNLIPEGFY